MSSARKAPIKSREDPRKAHGDREGESSSSSSSAQNSIISPLNFLTAFLVFIGLSILVFATYSHTTNYPFSHDDRLTILLNPDAQCKVEKNWSDLLIHDTYGGVVAEKSKTPIATVLHRSLNPPSSSCIFCQPPVINPVWNDDYLVFSPRELLYKSAFSPLTMATFKAECLIEGSDEILLKAAHLHSMLFHVLVSWTFYLSLIFLTRSQTLSIMSSVMFSVLPSTVEAVTHFSARQQIITALLSTMTLLLIVRSIRSLPFVWQLTRFFSFSFLILLTSLSDFESGVKQSIGMWWIYELIVVMQVHQWAIRHMTTVLMDGTSVLDEMVSSPKSFRHIKQILGPWISSNKQQIMRISLMLIITFSLLAVTQPDVPVDENDPSTFPVSNYPFFGSVLTEPIFMNKQDPSGSETEGHIPEVQEEQSISEKVIAAALLPALKAKLFFGLEAPLFDYSDILDTPLNSEQGFALSLTAALFLLGCGCFFIIGVLMEKEKRDIFFFGFAWLIWTLSFSFSPVSALARSAYIASLPFCILVPLVISFLGDFLEKNEKVKKETVKWIKIGVFVALVALLASRTVVSSEQWADNATLYSSTLKRYPDHKRSLLGAGYASFIKEDFDSAKEKLIKLEYNQLTLKLLGSIAFRQEDYSEALDYFVYLTTEVPQHPAHNEIAMILWKLGLLEAAERHVLVAEQTQIPVTSHEKIVILNNKACLALLRTKDHTKASHSFNSLFALFRNSHIPHLTREAQSYIHFNRALSLAHTGFATEALAAMSNASDLNPTFVDHHTKMAQQTQAVIRAQVHEDCVLISLFD